MKTTATHLVLFVSMLFGSSCAHQVEETCEQICECSEKPNCVEGCEDSYNKRNCGQGTNGWCRNAKDDLADCIEENGCGGCDEEFLIEEEDCCCCHM